MSKFIDRHYKPIIVTLALIVAVFIIACSTQSVICQWLFGCGVS